MKKFLTIFLSVLFAVSLFFTGCSDKPSNESPYADLPETSAEEFIYQEIEGGIGITGFTGQSKIIKIPEKIDNMPVTKIGMSAFYMSSIETLILPDTMTDILNEAFANCNQLTTVYFNEGLINIHQQAFENCTALESASFPDTLEKIGSYAFSHCTKLREININGTDLFIGMEAFYSNSSLETLTIDGVEKISDNAFGGCDKLLSVKFLCDFPESINGYTFRKNDGTLPTLLYKKGASGTDNSSLNEYTLEAY